MLALDRAQRGSVQFLTFMSQYTVLQPQPAGKQEVYLQIRKGSVDTLSTNKPYLVTLDKGTQYHSGCRPPGTYHTYGSVDWVTTFFDNVFMNVT